MKTFRLIAIVCALISQSGRLTAAAPSAPTLPEQTEEFRQCMDAVDLSAFKNSQWQDCQKAELNRAEKRLKLVEADRLKNYSENAPKIVLAFASWRQFREQYCEWTANSGETPSPEFNRLTCLSLLTLQQAAMLEEGL